MSCCFVRRVVAIENQIGKCAFRIGDWHPTDGSRGGSQVTILRDNGDSEYGHGASMCEALTELERSIGIKTPAECGGCER